MKCFENPTHHTKLVRRIAVQQHHIGVFCRAHEILLVGQSRAATRVVGSESIGVDSSVQWRFGGLEHESLEELLQDVVLSVIAQILGIGTTAIDANLSERRVQVHVVVLLLAAAAVATARQARCALFSIAVRVECYITEERTPTYFKKSNSSETEAERASFPHSKGCPQNEGQTNQSAPKTTRPA